MGKNDNTNKTIELYFLINCPHCQKAFKLIKNYMDSEPKYQNVKFEFIEEEINKEKANSKDYYYVPTFYFNNEKVHEGIVDEVIIKKILDLGLEG